MEIAGKHYVEAVRSGPNYDSANGNLGVYYAHRSNYYGNCADRFQRDRDAQKAAENREKAAEYLEKAAQCFLHASRINPYLSSFHANLGMAYMAQNKLAEAEVELRWAVKIDPGNVAYRANLRAILFRQGRVAEMLAQQREMIRMCPNDIVLLNETAWLLATSPEASLRNAAEAVACAQRAVKLSQDNAPTVLPTSLGTLAAAYAEAGRFPEAVETARTAIDLALKQNRRDLADSIAAKISLYEAGKPFHEPPSPPRSGPP
jgi:protein O-mannosyl-transferase